MGNPRKLWRFTNLQPVIANGVMLTNDDYTLIQMALYTALENGVLNGYYLHDEEKESIRNLITKISSLTGENENGDETQHREHQSV